jgi:tetratricopeptide (TPR) repeat protein
VLIVVATLVAAIGIIGISKHIRIRRVRAHIDNGYERYFKGEYDTALAEFTEALRLDPQSADAYAGRGNVYYTGNIAQTDYARGEAEYAHAVRLNPTFAAYSRGIKYYREENKYDQAIAEFTEAIRTDPLYVFSYNYRGSAYSGKRNYDSAIADYNRAIDLVPNCSISHSARGSAYANKRQYDQAITDCNKAIGLDPNNSHAYTVRGYAYGVKGQYDQAITDLSKAIELDPNNQWAKDRLREFSRR